jgi:23S rRNA (cytosine1962-C5)-methyltransferase
MDHRGRVMGMALLSPSSLIRGRIYSRRAGELCDEGYLVRALEAALSRRRRYLSDPLPHSYRLVHSDADGVPGLTVDVFGDHVVMQITTAAMELRREGIIDAIKAVLAPRVLIEKSESPVRTLENLSPRNEVVFGTPDSPLRIEENGIVALADLVGGQKTGYYLDQVENRRRARRWFAGARVLDAFCYVGAWSLVAADAGAVSVMAVDSSKPALDMLQAARELNPAAQECAMELVKADAFEHLRALASQGAQFDAIVLDPPPLARSAKDKENALRAYRDLNRQGFKLLAPGGVLITSCCSHAVSAVDFADAVARGAREAGADPILLDAPPQPADHPVHLHTPETGYIKTLVMGV